ACLGLDSNAVLENAGTFVLDDNALGDGYYTYVFGDGTGTVHNTGTITTTGTGEDRYFDANVNVDNDGTVNALDGLIISKGGGTSSGTFTAAAGKTLTIQDMTLGGASITGAGTVALAGTITATGAGLS